MTVTARRAVLGAAAAGLLVAGAPTRAEASGLSNAVIFQQDWDAFWERQEAFCNGLDTVTRPQPIKGAPIWPNRNARAAEARAAYRDLERMHSDAEIRAMLRKMAGTTLRPLKVLCLGDSITAGADSVDGCGYRTYLADLLDRAGYAATVVTDATGGATLPTVTGRLGATLAQHSDANVVLLLVGTNDATWSDLTGWQGKYDAAVGQILSTLPNAKVICGKIPISDSIADAVIANPNVPAQQAYLNTLISAVVAGRQGTGRVVAADMTEVPSSWLVYGWHPGDAGYLRMAHVWLSAMTPWLQ